MPRNLDPDHRRWLSACAAARILGCAPTLMPKVARASAGRLRVKHLPGCTPQYLAEDIERIRDECIEIAAPRPKEQEPKACSA